MTNWTEDLETVVFSIVKSATETKLKAKYPKIIYSTTDTANTTTNLFPAVYIHLDSAPETAFDNEGGEIQAVNATFGVRVTVNSTKEDCKKVMSEITNAFKGMKFRGTSLPVIRVNAELFIAEAIFSRTIGATDII